MFLLLYFSVSFILFFNIISIYIYKTIGKLRYIHILHPRLLYTYGLHIISLLCVALNLYGSLDIYYIYLLFFMCVYVRFRYSHKLWVILNKEENGMKINPHANFISQFTGLHTRDLLLYSLLSTLYMCVCVSCKREVYHICMTLLLKVLHT